MWNPFAVVDANHYDPTIYPVLSEPRATFPFAFEPADGDQPSGFMSKEVSVLTWSGQGWTQTWHADDFDFGMVITSARVVFYCEKYTKAGGYRGFGVGGLLIAGAANAVSHAAAAARRQGKLLVGQVRYSCLTQVAAEDGPRGNAGIIRLGLNAGSVTTPQMLAISVRVPRSATASSTAGQIVSLACWHRLQYGPVASEQDRTALNALMHNPGYGSDPYYPGTWNLPTPLPVGANPAPPAVWEAPPARR